MAKPRVMIVDTDLNYIIPLQLKFVEEYFESVDLEIITDVNVFQQKFSTPQRANVLVIADSLYDSSLQRHNITSVFLMTEQEDNEQPDSLNVTRIYKYTNIKSIFSQITRSNLGSTEPSMHKDSSQLIMVTSACGGVGKTTIALSLCQCLATIGKKVLYINADYLQSFQYRLANKSPICDSNVYAQLAEFNDSTYGNIRSVIRKEEYYYVPPFKTTIMSVGLEYSVYGKLAMAAKNSNEYDYVVVDAIHSFDEENAKLMKMSDKVIIITLQSEQEAFATGLFVSNINGVSTEKYIILCNDFEQAKDNALLSSEFTSKFGVNEYIEHITNCERMTIGEIAKCGGIKKVAFLIM